MVKNETKLLDFQEIGQREIMVLTLNPPITLKDTRGLYFSIQDLPTLTGTLPKYES